MKFTHFDPRRATFCGLQIQESDSYTVKRVGSALVLAASPQDACADRDSILSGAGRAVGEPKKGVVMSLTNAPRVRWLALALTLATVALAACGGSDDSKSGSATTSGVTSGSSEAVREAIVIKAQANLQGVEDVGDVLQGSSLGDSPFCSGGTFSGGHENVPAGSIDRTFKCREGTLRIVFTPTPGAPNDPTVTGRWRVLSGTGAFKGTKGSGRMETKFETDTRARETFTGTVVR
jgi:hypothetical protein